MHLKPIQQWDFPKVDFNRKCLNKGIVGKKSCSAQFHLTLWPLCFLHFCCCFALTANVDCFQFHPFYTSLPSGKSQWQLKRQVLMFLCYLLLQTNHNGKWNEVEMPDKYLLLTIYWTRQHCAVPKLQHHETRKLGCALLHSQLGLNQYILRRCANNKCSKSFEASRNAQKAKVKKIGK